jgi:integrase
MPEVAALDGRRLPTITRDEIFQIILAVHATGRESTSENLTRTIRPFFNWMGGDGRRLRYGVVPGLLAGIKAPERTLVETHEDDEDEDTGEYVPPLSELGRIIAIARSGALSPLLACAVEFTCWTVQRRRAITGARLSDFMIITKSVDKDNLPPGVIEVLDMSEGVWRVPPASRKTRTKSGAKKKPHVIPLPAPAWACVMRAVNLGMQRGEENKFLFPAKRPRRAGDPVGPMHPSTLTHAFLDLPDCGASPHDVRRTMASDGEALLGLDRKDTKAILDHAEGKATDKVLRRSDGADVTDIHYSFHDGTHFTWPIMRAWCAALEREIEIATADLEPLAEIMQKLGDRSYRIGAPPQEEPEEIENAAVPTLRPLRPPDEAEM